MVHDPAALCPEPAVAITAPRDGSVVAPGPITVIGTTATAGELLVWSASDLTGAQVASGFATSAPLGETGLFTIPLTLAAGRYTVETKPADTSSGGPGEQCAVATSDLVVDGSTPGPRWPSGASGNGVANGGFAAWRGAAVAIGGTWADSGAGQLALWQLQPGGEYGAWTGDLEIAVGAIDRGETWAEASRGAYDARWSRSLRLMAELWGDRGGTLYIRFAHEFNGDWYPWSVGFSEVDDFQAAWHRFRALQLVEFPSARLVFAPNSTSVGRFGSDWREAFPGPGQVDVVSVSYFNGWPYVDSVEAFQQLAVSQDQFGGPRGIEQHREFARSVGLPFAVSEWANHAQFGDSSPWVEQMYGFFNAHAGTGAGQVLYEIAFNAVRDGNAFGMYPETRTPLAAAAYRRLWSGDAAIG